MPNTRIRKIFLKDRLGWALFYLSIFAGIALTWVGPELDSLFSNDTAQFIEFSHHFYFFMEMASILVSFSIFFMVLFSYNHVPNTKLLAAGCTFFASGVINVIHLVSYTGNVLFPDPDMIAMRTVVFLVLSRFSCAVGLVIVCLLAENRQKSPSMPLWVGFTTVVIGLIIWFVAWNPLHLVWVVGDRPGTLLLVVMYITVVLLFLGLFLTLKNYNHRPDKLEIFIASAFILLACSELLSLYAGFDSNYADIFALFLKTAGRLLLFNVFYIHGIQRPFLMLSETKDALNTYVNDLDRQVAQRTKELSGVNLRLINDVNMARNVQQSMLPAMLPKNDSSRFTVGYIPAEQLSGDFYNAFRIDESRFGFCVGDVAGHGVSAAMLTVFAFQSVQTIQNESGTTGILQPSYVLKHLYDGYNATNFMDEYYMGMLYCVYNTETSVLTYANGGLNTTPYRVRPDGSLTALKTDGIAICKMGELIQANYQNKQLLLFPGDKLVVYTDGLVEAKNPEGEEYGMKRLEALLSKNARMGLEELKTSVLQDVKLFSKRDKPTDDITLLLMEVTLPF